MKNFVVIDEAGNVSPDLKGSPQAFAKWSEATKRAIELANCVPGETIGVYRLCSKFTAPVGNVVETPVKDAV
jgi:hypothetical protein